MTKCLMSARTVGTGFKGKPWNELECRLLKNYLRVTILLTMLLMDRIIEYLGKQSKTFLIPINILILIVIGVVDYLTGYEIVLSLFYLIPISFAAWLGGRAPGIIISVLSLMTMTATDFIAGKAYQHYFVEAWNLLMHLGFFVVYAIVLSQVKADSDQRSLLVHDLQKALNEVKQLSGLLPICASCKKIRDDKGYWNEIETYISAHSEAQFTHGICPECTKRLYPKEYDRIAENKEGKK